MTQILANYEDKLSLKESYYKVEGGNSLYGETGVPGAKNAAIPAIVAACLSKEDVLLSNVPLELNDVKLLIDLLVSMGAKVEVLDSETIICNGVNWNGGILDREKASKIRHSLLILGASTRWKKEVTLPLPGGCDIGDRKHDMHVQGLKTLGDFVDETVDQIRLIPSLERLEETVVEFYYPTFGGTLNIIFAALVGEGNKTVIIKNAARNPEVIDVINLLNKMGAKIDWVDNRTLVIKNVNELKGTNYSVMGDRIIASTLITATGITKGNTFIKNISTDLLKNETNVWKQAGLLINDIDGGIEVKWEKPLFAVDIVTEAFPGFHTDIQPLHTVLMTTAMGESKVKETILDGRFTYCDELNKLGANIEVVDGNFKCVNGASGQVAIVKGVNKLLGGQVRATDIRGGAAVVVAALAAEGTSKITNLYQIERGYPKLPEMLNLLGANIVKK